MSRTTILFQNLTGAEIQFAKADDTNKDSPAYRGTDWGDTVPSPGTSIPVSATPFTLGSEGDPGVIETDHWGWIYLLHTETQQKLQVYLRISKHAKIVEVGVSNFDKESNVDHPYGSNTKFANSRSFFCGAVGNSILITMAR